MPIAYRCDICNRVFGDTSIKYYYRDKAKGVRYTVRLHLGVLKIPPIGEPETEYLCEECALEAIRRTKWQRGS